MGLDPLFLRLAGLHFDPLHYPAVSLHLDLYARGAGLPREQLDADPALWCRALWATLYPLAWRAERRRGASEELWCRLRRYGAI